MELRIETNRTHRKILIASHGKVSVDSILEENGYTPISVFDIVNCHQIKWEDFEFNRIYIKDGILYRFNYWTGEHYPYNGIEIEEIGKYFPQVK